MKNEYISSFYIAEMTVGELVELQKKSDDITAFFFNFNELNKDLSLTHPLRSSLYQ